MKNKQLLLFLMIFAYSKAHAQYQKYDYRIFKDTTAIVIYTMSYGSSMGEDAYVHGFNIYCDGKYYSSANLGVLTVLNNVDLKP